MNRSSAPASSPARALPPIPDPGSWASWGRQRRRFVALTVIAWVAVAVVVAVAMALNEVAVLLALLPLLAWEWWIQDRLQAAEGAERTWAYDPPETPDERALLDELDGTRSEREADLVIAREMLAGSAVVRRYEYPTRELLVVRSVAEAVQILGLTLVILTAPAVPGVALGGLLWFLGGRSGAGVAESVLGRRLQRTAVDDEARARWIGRERKLVRLVALVVLVLAAIRFL